jgi:hypothetical protein
MCGCIAEDKIALREFVQDVKCKIGTLPGII